MEVLDGCMPPAPMEADEAAEPYPVGSIESLLAVLGRRAGGGRVLGVAAGNDNGNDRDDDDDEEAVAAEEAASLGPRAEAPRLLFWAAGAGWLIFCPMARPELLLTCLGCGGGWGWLLWIPVLLVLLWVEVEVEVEVPVWEAS